MVNINKLMKQAQEMQAQMTRRLEEARIEASSGGGAVTVVMNGKKDLISLSISKDAVDPADVEMLEDLVKAAFHEATRRVDEEVSEQFGGMLPPGFTPPF